MTPEQLQAYKNFLLCLADDEFMIGHRNAEWTGLGPIIEEDIAFSSMAQDELGHALGFYTLLHEMGEPDPDVLAFQRQPGEYRNSICTELPHTDYAFSLMRQLLYDAAEAERLEALTDHPHEQLKDLAAKILQEERYHWVHNTAMVKRLAGGTEESHLRMQSALADVFPSALGLFETYEGHDQLVDAGLAPSEPELLQRWLDRVCPLLTTYGLRVPAHEVNGHWIAECEPVHGGRWGEHTEHLLAIVGAIQTLTKADPEAVW